MNAFTNVSLPIGMTGKAFKCVGGIYNLGAQAIAHYCAHLRINDWNAHWLSNNTHMRLGGEGA